MGHLGQMPSPYTPFLFNRKNYTKSSLGLGFFSAFFNVLVTCFRLPVFTGLTFSQVPSGIAFTDKTIAGKKTMFK